MGAAVSADANKQLIRDIYAEVSKGNVQRLLDSLAEDVEWTIIGSTALSGVFRGKQDIVDRLPKPLRRMLPDGPIVFEVDRVIAEGEFVVMQARGRATAVSGRPYNNTYCMVYRVVDGKVRQLHEYIDTELLARTLT